MSLSDHTLRLSPREDLHGVNTGIDRFMRSLAEERGRHSVGVILSGTGSDGTLGVAEIQARGGVTFAQDESTAKYDSMPRSAIAAGYIDYVLAPKDIARELARIANHPYVSTPGDDGKAAAASEDAAGLSRIFQLLRQSTSVDFAHYRQTTILRRIQRRMVVHKFDKLKNYVRYVLSNPPEVRTLYQDMLINVTSFFRNPKVFDALKSEVFPAMLKQRPPNSAIRIWTPGCSSGEETYSLAIALVEFVAEKGPQIPIQIFGTDVSESIITKARAGIFPENIQGDVSSERLRRFFTRIEGVYQISKSIREMCIFAQHNVVNDPPFSQMDLICCRNLLIYLEPVLQNKVISLLHYALRPYGYLALGTSEGVGGTMNLFTTQNHACRIFKKKASAGRQMVTFSLDKGAERKSATPSTHRPKVPDAANNFVELQKEFDRRLLVHFPLAALFINEDAEILHSRGPVNYYLKLAPGRASLNLLKMALDGLQLDLRNALARAKKENRAVRKQRLLVKNGDGNGPPRAPALARLVNFEVTPLTCDGKEIYFMVTFEDSLAAAPPRRSSKKEERRSEISTRHIRRLEQELSGAKGHLQSVIETEEATNEELQSANEEILSSNEELQSTNEELETAKEELQSANEELSTVNDELRNRNLEVNEANADLTNLLTSIGIAVIMVGSDLTIRRFTQRAEKLFGLIPGDAGRPLVNINLALEIPDLQKTVSEVLSNGATVDKTITDRNGNRFLLRVRPYRTAENKTDGAVITLVD
jgi:two-component system, chemotaxis family, CheB/CheR fusion protein